jgi:hypothetical protein
MLTRWHAGVVVTMAKCESADRFREVLFEQGDRQYLAWTRDRLRLGQTVQIIGKQGYDGDWFIRALTTNTLCETEMRAKANERPKLYPLVETE